MPEILLAPLIMRGHRCITTLILLMYKTYVDVYTLDLLYVYAHMSFNVIIYFYLLYLV